MSEFSTKVVLITAAYGNIMKATAKAFAKQGAALSINGLDEGKLAEVAAEYKNAGAKEVLTIQADLTKTEDLDRVINETVKKFGKLDILVNCVGGAFFSKLSDFTSEIFDISFNLHVKVIALLIQKAIPHLAETKGNIINVSGLSSELHGMSNVFTLSLAHAAKDKLTKMAALELAPKGIRVNSVNPTGCVKTVDTDEATKQLIDEGLDYYPLGNKLIEFDEVASSILFLASEKANTITGQILRVDRGRALTGQ